MKESLKKPQTCQHRDIERMGVKIISTDLHGHRKAAEGEMDVSSPAKSAVVTHQVAGDQFRRLLQEGSLASYLLS